MVNERAYADFVFEFLQNRCPHFITLERIPLSTTPERHSIFAKTDGPLDVLFAVHLDTVVPSKLTDGSTDNFKAPRLEKNRYFHLGAADTKGGACALLTASEAAVNAKGVGVLFYTDEEYDFAGMTEIVTNELLTANPPKRAIVIEPSDLMIECEHRGLIEFKYRVFGESGHAGRDHEGMSAARAFAHAYVALEAYLRDADDERIRHNPLQRRTAMNLAYMVSGQQPTDAVLNHNKDESTEPLLVSITPNKKPDITQVVFDIRPGDPKATSSFFTDFLNVTVRKFGCRGEVVSTKHEHAALSTDVKNFEDLRRSIKAVTKVEAQTKLMQGYGDGQILSHVLRTPVCYLGPTGTNFHNPNEYVELDSVDTLADIYQHFMENHD